LSSNSLRGERLGVEVTVEPLAPLVVFGMRGVGEDREQLPIAPRPTAVLRRAGAPTVDAAGTATPLDDDPVVPPVAEVVGVPERGSFAAGTGFGYVRPDGIAVMPVGALAP